MTTPTAVKTLARVPVWRLVAVIAVTLLLHVGVLREAERGLAFDLPPPVLPIQAELFQLPAPISVQSADVRARPVSRAITLPGKSATIVTPAPSSATSASAASTEVTTPHAGDWATGDQATGDQATQDEDDSTAARSGVESKQIDPAHQTSPRRDEEQIKTPAAGAAVGAATASSDASAHQDAAKPPSAAPATEGANDNAGAPLRAVVVDFPKLGRFSSDVTFLRGWLRFFGTTVIEWRINASGFQARSETHDDRGVEWLLLTSRGRVLPDVGVAPERYTERVRNRAEVSAFLDPDLGRVTFSSTAKEFPWVRGTQDRLSFMAQLALVAQAFPERLVPEQPIRLPVAGPRDVRLYDLRVAGRETIGTPSGVYDAIKIDRYVGPEQKDEPRIELWLVPELHYLPVRTRTTFADGGVLETLLREVTLEN